MWSREYITNGDRLWRPPFGGPPWSAQRRTLRNQNDLDIADVRAGGAGADQVAKAIEERVRVVVVEISHRVADAGGRGPRERRGIDERAGGVGGTIDPVGSNAGAGHR